MFQTTLQHFRGNNARTTYLDETGSGRRKQAKDTGTTHRGTVPVEGRWTNQAFVQQQRRCRNRRGGDEKTYPLVVVTVVDTDEHTTEIINA